MKIVLLSAASSIHTVRWANGLDSIGHEVHVISQHPAIDSFNPTVKVHLLPYRGALGYFTSVLSVRALLNKINPHIVNAHYASGYATTARLAGYHPWLLSVWGSDIYDFPNKTYIHKWLVQKNLRAADHVASTSYCMADETRKLVPELNDISITPFGVNLNDYSNLPPLSSKQEGKLVIGTVKTMKPKYGIDTLIEAYSILTKRFQNNPELILPRLELRLVGGGEQTKQLQLLAANLGISDSVKFIGQVPHSCVPQELAKLDIYVALSRLDSESFGVAIVEASASARPVIVSDAGGLPEVTVNGETGIIVPRDDPEAAADALEKLILNPELRHSMGINGRLHVSKYYSWDQCISTMLDTYKKTIQNYK
ncbi:MULTISPECIES: glycosyltransferase [Providencia]|uniref:Glycosyltransferase n=2 Tax=Providencia TaxID=586 RepID=A0ABD5LD03_PROST|nr:MULTISPECIES: glycosyltransferase [Providencia]ELR5292998.1 glycosyltransferase [Providencia stuartii]MCR4181943.1 glycosyltransferase [Providencia vermicola]QIC17637.1 glycosyltransferase family 4 protein [Providencia vermicola]URE78554.1 glycosyltransferase [Providencia stuartii]